ncbi:MAG: cyclic peptide export ABC transporter [Holophagales bacterium]|nr:cyclic peptide export ABC transporter [Holophagales bacterium]
MKLLDLIREESDLDLPPLVAYTAVSGLSNAMLLVILNMAVEDTQNDSHSFSLLFMFAIALVGYTLPRRHVMTKVMTEIERILDRIRVRIADKVRRSELRAFESVGEGEIYHSIHRETITISQSAKPILTAVQSGTLFLFTILYIAWLSLAAFAIFNAIVLLTSLVYLWKKKRIGQQLREALGYQNRLFAALSDVLDGFKEVKMSSDRNQDLFTSIQNRSEIASSKKIDVDLQFVLLYTFTQTAIFVGIAAMVFLAPEISPTYDLVAIKVTTALLYLIGPIFNAVGAIPDIAEAEVAIQTIREVEGRLDQHLRTTTLEADASFADFETLRFEQAVFAFDDQNTTRPFVVGPIDLEIRRGEVLFITGGNGSGKSTFLKLLTALYFPQQGRLAVDQRTLEPSTVQAYRDLFCVIFADYHLFERLYGLYEIKKSSVADLLEEMELTGKTRFVEDRFEPIDLSTGQRKRLALIVTMLEDRPIYVFDEWAAEQDPLFRRRFYHEVLPSLKAKGKTVIAVTHDDKYFQLADRIIHMEEGRIVDEPWGGATL